MKLDSQTLELPGLGEAPPKLSRLSTGKAKSSKVRMAEYRQRQKEQARS